MTDEQETPRVYNPDMASPDEVRYPSFDDPQLQKLVDYAKQGYQAAWEENEQAREQTLAGVSQEIVAILEGLYQIELEAVRPGDWRGLAELKKRYREAGLTELF